MAPLLLAGLGVLADNAWADIDVQLKRRHDLIPNLVETVRGYAGHERSTFEAVIAARNQAVTARGPRQQQAAEQQLGASLGQLFAVAEAYPQLRAAERFGALQDSLSQIERTLQEARRYYNAVVRDLNTAILQFPSNLVAAGFGFRARSFFELDDPSEASVPRVHFDA